MRHAKAALAAVLTLWTGALFAAEPVALLLQMDQTGNHAMGSQIRRHENQEPQARAPRPAAASSSIAGMDVSSWQGNVDWDTAYADGARFAYVKATESTSYINTYFAQQYNGAYGVGMIRGAYHFALPDVSTGAEQAEYFLDHGGGWSADGLTLPGALDMEYNPYGASCYGLSQSAMAEWIDDFVVTYYGQTGRYPTIYTSNSWWSSCVGSAADFSSTDALWVARYASAVGDLPYPWSSYTFWQYDDSGTFVGDQDLFNGSQRQLQVFARRN